jgi:DNA topoisomerase-1
MQLDPKKTERIEFYEITKSKILEAIAQPRAINMDMVQSQEARRILDRIVGFMLSKILNKKVYSPAGGRVQSVALRFVIEREIEVLAFVPQAYYTLKTSLTLPQGPLNVEATQYQGQTLKMADDKSDPKGYKKIIPIDSEAKANDLLNKLPTEVTLTDVSMQKKKRESKAAFRTSTLQQDASSYLKFSPKKTQKIAQELYEGVSIQGEQVGLITYMRTDSDRLSAGFTTGAQAFIAQQYGEAYVASAPKSKTVVLQSQDAHEAIRPTSVLRTPESIASYLSSDQLKLYRLIFNRALASLMTSQQYEITTYTLTGGDFTFKVSGSVVTFPGFRRAYGMSEETDDPELPQLFQGQVYPPSRWI